MGRMSTVHYDMFILNCSKLSLPSTFSRRGYRTRQIIRKAKKKKKKEVKVKETKEIKEVKVKGKERILLGRK